MKQALFKSVFSNRQHDGLLSAGGCGRWRSTQGWLLQYASQFQSECVRTHRQARRDQVSDASTKKLSRSTHDISTHLLCPLALYPYYSTVQPTSSALKEQSRISLQAALTEIEELKQSQRCVEISLAKQIEENEQLTQKLGKQVEKAEVSAPRRFHLIQIFTPPSDLPMRRSLTSKCLP